MPGTRGSDVKNILMALSNENIFRVTGPMHGEFTGRGEFPTQRPVTRSFDNFFDPFTDGWEFNHFLYDCALRWHELQIQL